MSAAHIYDLVGWMLDARPDAPVDGENVADGSDQ